MNRPTIKTCKCCGKAYTRSEFDELPEVGTMADEPGWMLVLANCTCGSTISIRVECERGAA
jgi:hypothetical protein